MVSTIMNFGFTVTTTLIDKSNRSITKDFVLSEDDILYFLFRFSDSSDRVIKDSNGNTFIFQLIFDKDRNSDLVGILTMDSKLGIIYSVEFDTFIMDLVESFINMHSISKFARNIIHSRLSVSDINEDDNIEDTEIDVDDIPDEFEDNDGYYDTEEFDEDIDNNADYKDDGYSFEENDKDEDNKE